MTTDENIPGRGYCCTCRLMIELCEAPADPPFEQVSCSDCQHEIGEWFICEECFDFVPDGAFEALPRLWCDSCAEVWLGDAWEGDEWKD